MLRPINQEELPALFVLLALVAYTIPPPAAVNPTGLACSADCVDAPAAAAAGCHQDCLQKPWYKALLDLIK